MLIGGLALAVAGVAMFTLAGGLIVAGLALTALAISEAWPEPTGKPRTRGRG